jgi:hypothetical protein
MQFKSRIVFSLGALSLAGAACDPAEAPVFEDTVSGDTQPLPDTGDDAVEPRVGAPACADLPPGEPLAPGLWASRQFRTSLVGLPPTGTLSEVEAKLMVLHEVSREDGEVRVRHVTCSITQPRLNGVETVFGPAFVAAVPHNTVTATVDGRDVVIPRDRIVLGANLVDPANDALPTEPDDPRVADMDNDGNPGMTVTLQGLFQAQLYITYRHHIGFIGTADVGGCIAGRLDGVVEQTQIGASDEALMSFDFSPQPHPDPDISTFMLVPVASGLTCADLLAQETAIFGN